MVGFVLGAGLLTAGAAIGGALLSDTSAGGRAAEAAAEESRQAEQRRRKDLQPFLQAGQRAVGGLEEGSTVGGLDARLGRIFDSDIFGRVVDERTRAVQGQLAAGGLTRSGTALQEIANVPSGLALQIEQLLSGRLGGLAGQGLQAGNTLAGLGEQGSQFRGEALSSGILTDAQATTARNQALLNATAGAVGSFGGFFGGSPQSTAGSQALSQIQGFQL